MSAPTIVGVRPWLPGALGRWAWFNDPVRAERLAALRIAVALCMLFDLWVTYAPFMHDYYGPDSLSANDVFQSRFVEGWNWSILRWLPDTWGPQLLITVWMCAAVGLLLGCFSRVNALIAWALAISFLNANYYLHNSGDRLRQTLLFFLMLSPCAAVWAVKLRPPRLPGETGARFIYPWVLRLLFIQMTLMYFFNGVYKLLGPEWRDGSIMHYIVRDAGWSRWTLPLPAFLERAGAWFVLVWELGFPLWILIRPLRVPALVIGAAFHILSGLQLELGMFPLYALCFYVPLIPWERTLTPRPPLP